MLSQQLKFYFKITLKYIDTKNRLLCLVIVCFNNCDAGELPILVFNQIDFEILKYNINAHVVYSFMIT